jgi:hypothetical protein
MRIIEVMRIVDGVEVTENSSICDCCVATIRLDTAGIIDGLGVTK